MRGNRGRVRRNRPPVPGVSQFSSLGFSTTPVELSEPNHIRNFPSKTSSNHQKQNLQHSLEILNPNDLNNDRICELLKTGELLKLLNSTTKLQRSLIHDLLSSFNQFKADENSPKSIKKVFILILNSSFFKESLEPTVGQYFISTPTKEEMKIMITFVSNCLELLPGQFIEKMTLLYPSVQFASAQFIDPDIKSLLLHLQKTFEIAKNKMENEKSLVLTLSRVAIKDDVNFRHFSVIPQSSDIFCLNEDVKLRPNKYAGENKNMDSKYESVDDYLDTQFCLLKEDFVRPLRDGIGTIRENLLIKSKMETKNLQIRIYENVIVENMFTSRNGLVYKIIFDVKKFKRIDWKKAKRFIYGSLLCFTNNFFDTIYFASVVDSDPKDLEKGFLVVQFNEDPIIEVLNNNEFMMIETKNLFEAYRHVLTKLQTFTTETLPFKEYFVFGENNKQHPAFMNKADLRQIDLEGKIDKDLDDSQNAAFVNALKSSLSLIQGPPGTGKTYVGLKIIKYLVNNIQTQKKNIGPILVVCYTNHALDQFLTDIIQAIGVENVIRVGGRSKLDIMKECNISNIRWKWIRKKAMPHILFKRGIQNRKDIESAEVNLIRKYVKVKEYDKKLLSLNDMRGCLNHNHIRFFQRVNFDSWIKGGDSILKSNLGNLSYQRERAMREVYENLVYQSVYEMSSKVVMKIFQEMNVLVEEFQDVIVEDPDDVLNNQRFLDEDVDLLKCRNKFQYLYNDIERNEGEENNYQVDEEGFKCVANVKLIKNRLKKVKPVTEDECTALDSLDVDFDLRLRLYKYWLEKYRIFLIEEYKIEKAKFDLVNKEKEEISFLEYIEIMNSAKVIGMTTTGAARYGSVLDRVGCRVVVIEEAAEVMESHVVCSLSEYCEQLIMIGDHKQLRPKVDVYDLEINYNLGISLFERLIANDCQYFTLQFQHRMRPEISTCVKPIYPDLKDSSIVFEYSSIVGMNTDMYFFNHNKYENESIETSYKNDFEADFVAKLCEYLVKSGNLPNNITVLTLYTGQLYNISNRMRQPFFKGIRICVVDNFQGEENEIIILSLVRSNEKGVVGFVNSPNRLCVALSRAKRGFYAIGNFSMLYRKIPLLKEIISNNLSEKDIGSKLPLKCLMHPDDNNYFITNLDDFSKPGCHSKCGLKLTCGHICLWTCHRDAPSHKGYKCAMNCEKKCLRNLHDCQLQCSQRCRCEERIILQLACGHEKNIICNENNIKCTEICEKILECNHKCLRMCYEQCKCEMKIKHVFECGHDQELVCGTDISEMNCLQLCKKTLGCGHICKKKCFEDCKCKEYVYSVLPCSHKRQILCGTDVEKVQCDIYVENDFNCGHSLKYKCFQKIDKCMKEIDKKLNCGHISKVLCGNTIDNVDCKFICETQLNCTHKCLGKCGECYQKRLHVECKGRCRKYLKCGHYCDNFCHSGFCQPCNKPCVKYCEHNQCTSLCGYTCDCNICELDCKKRIKCINCKKLGECSKLCGESCINLCTECLEKQEIAEQEFYIMEPCNCYIRKKDFKPELQTEKKQMHLNCQKCHRQLRIPHRGVILTYMKKTYSGLFETLPEKKSLEWLKLFKELKKMGYQPLTWEKMIENITTVKVCKYDVDIYDTSYKYCQEIMDICNIMVTIVGENNIKKYHINLKTSLYHLINWLNPFIRNFEPEDVVLYEVEKSKLSLSSNLLSYLNTVSVTDYGLIHKQSFDVLDEIDTIIIVEDVEKLYEKFEDIKNILKNPNAPTVEEEELVEKIIASKEFYKEFAIEMLSNEDKLKAIKKLIIRCHPDKNNSEKANEAVRKLLQLKKRLE